MEKMLNILDDLTARASNAAMLEADDRQQCVNSTVQLSSGIRTVQRSGRGMEGAESVAAAADGILAVAKTLNAELAKLTEQNARESLCALLLVELRIRLAEVEAES